MPEKLKRIKNAQEVFEMNNETVFKLDRQYRKWANEKLEDMLAFMAERTVVMSEATSRKSGHFDPVGSQLLYLNDVLGFVTAFLTRAQQNYMTAIEGILKRRPKSSPVGA